MKPFDEAAGQLLDELLRSYRIYGRHRTACALSMALERAREEGRAEHWLHAPIAEVDAELRRLGLDPAEVGAEGERVAREALAKRGRRA